MTKLAAGISWIDLKFLGRPHAIATAVLSGSGELALIDPGPNDADHLSATFSRSLAPVLGERLEAALRR